MGNSLILGLSILLVLIGVGVAGVMAELNKRRMIARKK